MDKENIKQAKKDFEIAMTLESIKQTNEKIESEKTSKESLQIKEKICDVLTGKKIVINSCYGGFSLSAKAVKRMAELNGKECYFFKNDYKTNIYTPLTLEECDADDGWVSWIALTIPNPNEYLPKEKRDADGTYKTYNTEYSKICLDTRPDERDDPNLIQVVEELGKEANGQFAELMIVTIPGGIDWEISEYDGMESIEEKHRSWR